MNPRYGLLAVMMSVVLTGSGCVSTGTYQAKELESLQLSKSLEESKSTISEINDKNAKLAAESEALSGKLKKLDVELIALKQEIDRLKNDNSKLKDESSRLKDENLKMAEALKPENLLKALANSLAELQSENSKLKLALEDVEKSVKKNSEPLRITPDIAKPAPVEEKKVDEKPASDSKNDTMKSESAVAEQKSSEIAPKP